MKTVILITILLVLSALFVRWEHSNANTNTYSYKICDTHKCKARVARLNQCAWTYDVVACATNETLDDAYEYIYD